MSFFLSHNRAFKAELIKMKHSGMLWLCLGAAIFIPLITTLVMSFVNIGNEVSTNAWNSYIQSNFGAFTGFFYPLFLVLVIGRLVYLEHRSDTWKLMETQPVSRFALFIAKFEAAALIALVCLLALLAFSLTGGLIIQITSPKYQFSASSIDWPVIFSAIARLWITGLAILSAQYFFGLLIKSFAWPIGIGLLAIIGGSILNEFNIFSWWPYSGTSKTSSTFSGSVIGNILLPHEKLSLLWTLAFLTAAYAYYSSRTFGRAFMRSPARIAITAASVALFFFLTSFLNKPVTVGRYDKTVLSGTVNDKTVKEVLLMKGPAFDTVAQVPVREGTFHGVIMNSLPAGTYYLKAGKFRGEIFMGDRDSSFIEIHINDKRKESQIRGTRMAENAYLKLRNNNSLYHVYQFAYQYTPQSYAEEIMSQWKNGLKKINDYTTSDQVRPSEDFLLLQRKLLALQLISLTDYHYPLVYSVYYPNEELKYPSSLDRLRKEININDASLISFPAFTTFISDKINFEFGKERYFDGIRQLISDTTIRKVVTYQGIINHVLNLRDSSRRGFMFASSLAEVNDPGLQKHLLNKAETMKKTRKGNPAGNISAESLNGSPFTLANFKGRFIVLDIWATWCKPCLQEAPFFEELAERYTEPEVAFVSISVDELKDHWKVSAAGKKNKVLQLWATNVEEDLWKGYAFNSIPRFMLIDNKGRILNSDMPPPSDPEFEAILVKEIPHLRSDSGY